MVREIVASVLQLLLFPGLAFLAAMGLAAEFADRKVYARLQNRAGPPFLQPLADLLKLSVKQEIIPREADERVFRAMPLVAMAATAGAFLYLPLWSGSAAFSFDGDLIVVLYLLMIPSMASFLGGLNSTSLFATIGAVRVITQFFAYEVPLFLALLAPALLAGSWSVSGIASFFAAHPGWWCFDLLGFAVSIVAAMGKLEKGPFDAPEAETEIVGGTLTEYSGRYLAIFRLTVDMETVVIASLIAAEFLPLGLGLPAVLGFLAYLLKVAFVLVLITMLRAVVARLRIDQMIGFCWQVLCPLAFVQVAACLILKGVLE